MPGPAPKPTAVGLVQGQSGYVTAAIAVISGIEFLVFISGSTTSDQEAAGRCLGAAIISGAGAAAMLYRARRDERSKALERHSTPVEPNTPTQLNPNQQLRAGVAILPSEIVPTVAEIAPLSADYSQPTTVARINVPSSSGPPSWLVPAVVITSVFVMIVGIMLSSSNHSVGTAHQSRPPSVVPNAFADVNWNAVSKCPDALPADVSIRPLFADELKNVVGTAGKLTPVADLVATEVELKNNTDVCLTKVAIEVVLNLREDVLREKHTLTFPSPLSPGAVGKPGDEFLQVNRKPDGKSAELQEWHVYAAWGYQLPN